MRDLGFSYLGETDLIFLNHFLIEKNSNSVSHLQPWGSQNFVNAQLSPRGKKKRNPFYLPYLPKESTILRLLLLSEIASNHSIFSPDSPSFLCCFNWIPGSFYYIWESIVNSFETTFMTRRLLLGKWQAQFQDLVWNLKLIKSYIYQNVAFTYLFYKIVYSLILMHSLTNVYIYIFNIKIICILNIKWSFLCLCVYI